MTRPSEMASDFIATLERCGAIPLVTPLIAIGPPDDPAAFREGLRRLSDFQWCVFSSANGVDAFLRAYDSAGAAAAALRTLRVAAVGRLTAERLERAGIPVAIVPREFVAESLAESIRAAASPHALVLIVRAQEGRDTLAASLRATGLQAVVVAAYRTTFVSPEDFERNVRAADAITFASSSAVTGFVSAAGGSERAQHLAAGKAIACIGPVAANTAREAGLVVDVVPSSYTGRTMIEALSTYFGQRA